MIAIDEGNHTAPPLHWLAYSFEQIIIYDIHVGKRGHNRETQR